MSNFFPQDYSTPFKWGIEHLKEGASNLSSPSGIAKLALGFLECIPVINYGVVSVEKTFSLSTAESIMYARRQDLKKELENDSVIFQQQFFETHNSEIPGRLPNDSPIYSWLGNSYPDRQLAFLINQLKAFSTQMDKKDGKLEEIISLLEKMEPFASIFSCVMMEPSKKNREKLMEKFVELIHERVSSMKDGEIIILPFGYANKDVHDFYSSNTADPGHMTLLEIRKIDDEQASVRLFDTDKPIDEKQNKVFPWKEKSTLKKLSSKEFWKDSLVFLENEGQVGMKDVYDKLNGLKTNPSNDHSENPLEEKDKSYHPQKLSSDFERGSNSCAKKSMQVWVHEMLKEQPALYQQFRIFCLDNLIEKTGEILEKQGSSEKISLNHAVALWGGSDKISSLKANMYYKFKGFFNGPHVKGEVPVEDLQKMHSYSGKIKTSRERRLRLLNGEVEEVTKEIKNSPLTPLEKAQSLQQAYNYCQKKQIKADEKLFLIDKSEVAPFLEECVEKYKINSIEIPFETMLLLITAIGAPETDKFAKEIFLKTNENPSDAFRSITLLLIETIYFCLKENGDLKMANKIAAFLSLPESIVTSWFKDLDNIHPKNIHMIYQPEFFYNRKNIKGKEPLQISIESLGLKDPKLTLSYKNSDQKKADVSLESVAEQLIKTINQSIENSTKETTKQQRHVELKIHESELAPYMFFSLDPKDDENSSIKIENLWIYHILEALKSKGHIVNFSFKIVQNDEFIYFIQC